MVTKLDEMEVIFETPSSLFSIPLPKISWKGKFTPNQDEERLAWSLFVELSTRVTRVGLARDEGSLREALASYHSLFDFVRTRLHEVGPQVGRARGSSTPPIAALTLWMLNGVVRPLLTKWHPQLSRYEEQRSPGIGLFVHEEAWPLHHELRNDLAAARDRLEHFARLFEQLCDVNPSIIPVYA